MPRSARRPTPSGAGLLLLLSLGAVPACGTTTVSYALAPGASEGAFERLRAGALSLGWEATITGCSGESDRSFCRLSVLPGAERPGPIVVDAWGPDALTFSCEGDSSDRCHADIERLIDAGRLGKDASSRLHALEATIDPARPRAVQPPPPTVLRDHWYGWQTLTADGISLGTIILGGVGLLGYFLAAPIVHASHSRWEAAGGSLALRLTGPLALGGLVVAACGERDGMNCLGAVAGGVAIGMVAAMVIDSAVLGWEKVQVPANAARPRTFPLGVVPGADGASLRLLGTF